MNHLQLSNLSNAHFPRWWRGVMIAVVTLIFCSCRWVHRADKPMGDATCPACVAPSIATTAPPRIGPGENGMLPGPAYYPSDRQWAPPGIQRPWPKDEYIHDGGDQWPDVRVASDWRVAGLEMEDTVVHYDTVDGKVVVEPSNKVSIYAPRFGAVRHVSNINEYAKRNNPAAVELPLPFLQQNLLTRVAANHQPTQVGINLSAKRETIYRTQSIGTDVTKVTGILGFQRSLLPYENLKIISSGTFENAEKGALAERVDAAITWGSNLGLQAIIEGKKATETEGEQRAQATFTYKMFPGDAKLRVIKIASKKDAISGESIDFTIRFDNVGDQPIGNVTLLDNLTPRLELVLKSDQCSVKSKFSYQQNDGGSVVLRWELEKPLKPGEGGIVRFKCRVR